MAKVDLGVVAPLYMTGNISSATTDLGALPEGNWLCEVAYPQHSVSSFGIIAAPDKSKHLIVTSETYRGAIIVACHSYPG